MEEFSTPDLCDVHHDVRVMHAQFSSYGGHSHFCGQAATIKCFEDNSLVKALAEEPGHGRVMVVDGGGSLRRALLGDQIAEKACLNGWLGLIINGAVRDVTILRTLTLGVFALGVIPLKTEKHGVGLRGMPVEIGGATVVEGDWIYADSCGVVVSDIDLLKR